MSEEQLKAFLEAIKNDAGLQEKLKAAGDADAVVAIAKAAGFVISVEELKNTQLELSEQELDGLSGGCLYSGAYSDAEPAKCAPYTQSTCHRAGPCT